MPDGKATMAVITAGRTAVIMAGTRAESAVGTTIITTALIAVRGTGITVTKIIIRTTVTRRIILIITTETITASDQRS